MRPAVSGHAVKRTAIKALFPIPVSAWPPHCAQCMAALQFAEAGGLSLFFDSFLLRRANWSSDPPRRPLEAASFSFPESSPGLTWAAEATSTGGPASRLHVLVCPHLQAAVTVLLLEPSARGEWASLFGSGIELGITSSPHVAP